MTPLFLWQFWGRRGDDEGEMPAGEFIMPWEVARREPLRMYWALWRADYRGYIPDSAWGRWLAARREGRR